MIQPPFKHRFLGIDYGERFMGFSISDPDCRVATPLKAIDRRVISFEKVLQQYLIAYSGFEALVIGLPLSMDGNKGVQAQKVERFADRLSNQFQVILWDERTTSLAVARQGKKKEHVDDLAATFMLQGFLDYANRLSNEGAI